MNSLSLKSTVNLSKFVACSFLALTALTQVAVRQAIAEDPAPPPSADLSKAKPEATPEKVETIKTGVIASSTKTKAFAAIDVETSGSAPGDETSVIAGSVSHVKRDECVAKVINNGDKTYSVSFNVVELRIRNKNVEKSRAVAVG